MCESWATIKLKFSMTFEPAALGFIKILEGKLDVGLVSVAAFQTQANRSSITPVSTRSSYVTFVFTFLLILYIEIKRVPTFS